MGLGAWYSLGLCNCECPSPCVSSRVSEAVGLHVTCRSMVVHTYVLCICDHTCIQVCFFFSLFLFNKCFSTAVYLPNTVLSTLQY